MWKQVSHSQGKMGTEGRSLCFFVVTTVLLILVLRNGDYGSSVDSEVNIDDNDYDG